MGRGFHFINEYSVLEVALFIKAFQEGFKKVYLGLIKVGNNCSDNLDFGL